MKATVRKQKQIKKLNIDTKELLKIKRSPYINDTDLIALLDKTDLPIWALDADHRLVVANRAAISIFAAASGTRPEKGTCLPDCIIPEAKIFWLEQFNRGLKGERFSFEFQAREDNAIKNYEVYVNPIETGDGSISVIWYIGKDISERTKTEEELLLKGLILDKASDAIMLRELDGKIVYVNEVTYKARGYTKEELLGMDIQQLLPPGQEKEFKRRLKEVLQNGSTSFEFFYARKDGTFIPAESNMKTIKIRGKTYILSIVRDITERKKAEEELQLKEYIIDKAGDTIILRDLNGKMIYANEVAYTSRGYTKEEFFRLSPRQLGTSEANKLVQPMKEASQRKGTIHYETTLVCKDGSISPVEIELRTIEFSGRKLMLSVIHDISERKKSEKALKESEEKYRNVVERANDGIVIIQDKLVKYVNARLAEMWGGTAEEIINTDFINYIHPDELSKIFDRYNRRIAGEHILPVYETLLKRKDGSKLDAELNVGIITYQGNAAELVIIRDITQRKSTEEELKLSSHIVNSTSDAIFVHDLKGNPVFVNKTAYESLGYTREELMGMNIRQIDVSSGHVDSIKIKAQNMAEYGSITFETAHRHKSGALIPVEVNGRIIESGGKKLVLGVVRDITERKKSEEELRLKEMILDNASDSIILREPGGKIIYGNKEAYTSRNSTRERFIGSDMRQYVAPKEVEKFDERTQMMIERGTVSFESMHILKDGTKVPVETSGTIIESGGKKLLLGVIRDITERKKMEEELKVHRHHLEDLVEERTNALKDLNVKLQDELAERKKIEAELRAATIIAGEASKAKSEFLARMSHEIRTPIHGVMGALDLALENKPGDETCKYISLAKSSAESLLSVINDILDFSKIEAGKVEIEECQFDLRSCTEDTARAVAVAAHTKGLEIVCHISRKVPTKLSGDPGHLRQILVNLVGNAVKFSEHGEISIRVQLESEIDKEAIILFSVEDTGIGIPEEAQKQLFQPFHQSDGTIRRRYGGTGLGLAISHQLVSMMGGRIWVESEHGKGSRFYFTIKCKKLEANEPDSCTLPAYLRGLNTLVISENSTITLVAKEIMEEWGLTVVEANDAISAMNMFDEAKNNGNGFKLVLIDCSIISMSCTDIIERVKSSAESKIPIVMMINSNKINIANQYCAKYEVQAYVVKPLSEKELFVALTKAFGAKSDNEPQPSITIPKRIGESESHILVVEDNQTSRLIAQKLLEKMNYKVSLACNGLEAAEMVRDSSYDLVLMDLEMPVMDGLQATQLIRERESKSGNHIPIIAMTAYATKEDHDKCLNTGMDSYLSKPVNPGNLHKAIKELLTA